MPLLVTLFIAHLMQLFITFFDYTFCFHILITFFLVSDYFYFDFLMLLVDDVFVHNFMALFGDIFFMKISYYCSWLHFLMTCSEHLIKKIFMKFFGKDFLILRFDHKFNDTFRSHFLINIYGNTFSWQFLVILLINSFRCQVLMTFFYDICTTLVLIFWDIRWKFLITLINDTFKKILHFNIPY